jgi:AcrR family transcriptional regulator
MLVGSESRAAQQMVAARTNRRYRSPLRAQQAEQTRVALQRAAAQLFTTRGWAGTGMRDVAREAGVATETLYAHFSSKKKLLQRVIDVAVVADDLAVPLAERSEFAELGDGSRAQRIAAAARLITAIHVRTAGLAKVLREAAPTDDAIAETLEAARERQRRDVEAGVELIVGRRPTESERDGVWALVSPDVYLLLVEGSSWSPAHYESWVAEVLDRVLPRA